MDLETFMATYKQAWERSDEDLLVSLFAPQGVYHNTRRSRPRRARRVGPVQPFPHLVARRRRGRLSAGAHGGDVSGSSGPHGDATAHRKA
jgi:hypothetical protein